MTARKKKPEPATVAAVAVLDMGGGEYRAVEMLLPASVVEEHTTKRHRPNLLGFAREQAQHALAVLTRRDR